MPKAAAPAERPAKAKRLRKSQLRAQYTDAILTELMEIRRALGYPTTAPSRPVVKPGEVVKKTFLFHGGTKPPVDGPTHWKFRDLGTFMHIVSKNGKFSQRLRDPRAIPSEVLAANEHLVSLIKRRADLTTPSRTTLPHDDREVNIDTPARSSSPSRHSSHRRQPIPTDLDEESDIDISDLCSTDRIQPSDDIHDGDTDLEVIHIRRRPIPTHLDEESDVDISDLCSTDRIQPSDDTYNNATDLEVIATLPRFSSPSPSTRGEARGEEENMPSERTSEFEIDELDSDEYRLNLPSGSFGNRGRPESSGPGRPESSGSGHPESSGPAPAITVITWSKNDTPARSIAIELTENRGPYISLAMISGDLRVLGLTEKGPELERFVSNKGWRRIGWNTLFPIHEVKVVVLKSMEVDDVKDWDLQLEHLYK
ncbi:hypothetical protein F5878DRAFT_647186 [Lentinula raphanica]|uniref:Uncharacterized protein n=1 Tax=Lentinula raphanica TaxID=153919 RepID=A0AA38NWR0_9AGAR|nr:hypothetical protein F5878DRAFT_647186 [Lentinula raphanica]